MADETVAVGAAGRDALGAQGPRAFHMHLDTCQHCQRNPFDLCIIGKQLIRAEAQGAAGVAPAAPPLISDESDRWNKRVLGITDADVPAATAVRPAPLDELYDAIVDLKPEGHGEHPSGHARVLVFKTDVLALITQARQRDIYDKAEFERVRASAAPREKMHEDDQSRVDVSTASSSTGSTASENELVSTWPRAEFLHCVLQENRDGNLWGDMLMELGQSINDDIEGMSGPKKYSFWVGEARELSATDGIGWAGVLRLMGEAIQLAAVDPVVGRGTEGSTREKSSSSDRASAVPTVPPDKDLGLFLDQLEVVAEWLDSDAPTSHSTPWLVRRDLVREAIQRLRAVPTGPQDVCRDGHQVERASGRCIHCGLRCDQINRLASSNSRKLNDAVRVLQEASRDDLAQAVMRLETECIAQGSAAPDVRPVPALETEVWFHNLTKSVRELVNRCASRQIRHHLLAAIDEAERRLRAQARPTRSPSDETKTDEDDPRLQSQAAIRESGPRDQTAEGDK